MNAQTELPSVLICDGNRQRLYQNRKLIGMFFQAEGAGDQADALSLIKSRHVQLAFIDKGMGMDFFSLCIRMNPSLWIIAVGEGWTPEEAAGFEEIGIRREDIFQYPFLVEDLREIAGALSPALQQDAVPYTQQELQGGRENVPFQAPYNEEPAIPAPPYQNAFQGHYPGQEEAASAGQREVPYRYQTDAAPPSVQPRSAPPVRQERVPPQAYPERTAPVPRGVYSFYAPKGGVGKTTVAVNMAYSLSSRLENARICLVDFDVFFGNVASLLKIKPNRTLLDWIHTPEEMNEQEVMENLVRDISGLWVLPAPVKAVEEEFITAELAEKILGHLRLYFDLILVDLGPVFRDSTLVALQQSEKILLITDLDRVALSDSYELAEEFREINVPVSKVELIFNNVSGSEGVSVKQATQAMPYPVAGILPHEAKMKWVTNNKNEPVVNVLPRSAFTKALLALAASLFQAGDGKQKKEKKSLFSFLGRKKEGGLSFK